MDFLKQNKKLVIVTIVALAVGFFGGMEYKKYQIRSAIDGAFQEIGNAFSEGDSDTNNEESENNNEQERAEVEENTAQTELNSKVDLTVIDKRFREDTLEDYIAMTFELSNNTSKKIAGVEGEITFYDIFDNEIMPVSFDYTEDIPAGESTVYESGISYNQFFDDHQKLKEVSVDKLGYEWKVISIVYADGTKDSLD